MQLKVYFALESRSSKPRETDFEMRDYKDCTPNGVQDVINH